MVSRRFFIQSAGATIAGLTLNRRAQAQAKRPNVLMLLADDMNGYGFCGEYPGVKVPHIKKFQSSALTFDLAYCGAPACIPSRASLFSGLYPHHTGSYLNDSDPWKKGIFTTLESMPECFKRAGYTTFGLGKVFHSNPEPKRWEAMWDNEFYGGGFGPFYPDDGTKFGHFWGFGPWEGPDSDFPDVKNSESAMAFLREKHEKPFFAVLGLWRPHTPFTAPKRFYEEYKLEDITVPPPGWKEGDLDDVPQLAKDLAKVWGDRYEMAGEDDPDTWRKFLRAYCASTTFADWSVGRVLDALDDSEYADDTIVVFWSDNGYHCGEKNHWEKTTLWEAASKIPFAIRMPDRKNAGEYCRRTVSALDVYPTLVDLCGLETPHQGLDGRSLRPLLDDPCADWDRPALTTYGEGYASVRDEQYRYIRYPDGTEELYDHSQDPHEFTNIAGNPEYAAVKARLGKLIPETFAKSFGGRLG